MPPELDSLGAAVLEADRTTPGSRVYADNRRGKRDRVTRPSNPHDAAHAGADQFTNAVEQCPCIDQLIEL